jgi:hypothetical protein
MDKVEGVGMGRELQGHRWREGERMEEGRETGCMEG